LEEESEVEGVRRRRVNGRR